MRPSDYERLAGTALIIVTMFGSVALVFALGRASAAYDLTEKARLVAHCGRVPITDQSTFCLTWRSTLAAEASSFWSAVQGVFTGLTLLGLILTLAYNFRALRQGRDSIGLSRDAVTVAREQATIAQATARATLRAYLDVGSPQPFSDETFVSDHFEAAKGYSVQIKNYGQTPARDVQYSIRYILEYESDLAWSSDDTGYAGDIAPTDDFTANGHLLMLEYLWKAVYSRKATMQIDVLVKYRDIYDLPHSVEVKFVSNGPKDAGLVAGSKVTT